MNESNLTLTAEEREFLVGLLQASLKETQVEEHRTRTVSFREHILHKEHVLQAILSKLGAAPA